jgi:hypothetical protein
LLDSTFWVQRARDRLPCPNTEYCQSLKI